eukprot:1098183-Rhodomonas_salina.4
MRASAPWQLARFCCRTIALKAEFRANSHGNHTRYRATRIAMCFIPTKGLPHVRQHLGQRGGREGFPCQPFRSTSPGTKAQNTTERWLRVYDGGKR